MPPVELAWDDRFLEYSFGPGHPFSERSRWLAVRLVEELQRLGPLPPGSVRTVGAVEPAARPTLERFHRPEYLERVRRLSDSATGEPLDAGDTPSFAGCFEAAARLVGGTLAAIDRAQHGSGVAFAPGGGLHHAHPERASGFCIFNDLAIGIATALQTGAARRVAYVDIDAHHGDGVMYGFYDDGRVLDIDFHQDGRTIFPGTGFPGETGRGDGAGRKVNVPLPPGTGDAGFTRLFRRLVPPLLEEFHPDLLVLQCGVDGHAGDRLGATALEYTPAAYRLAVTTVRECARAIGDRPLVVTGGGGYSAEHVARVLARVPVWLLGEDVPAGAPLPDAWRSRFERETGWPAPEDWTVPPSPSRWSERTESGLVRDLERALGCRFPAPAP
jgi:acetoin utilization protein AcuC